MPTAPSITTVASERAYSINAGTAEHRRQAERAGDDRGVALGAAELGGEAGDTLRIHQRGVGRGQLVGEDHRSLAQAE